MIHPNKTTIIAALVLGLAASQTILRAETSAPPVGEAQAWRILQFRVQQDGSPDNTIKLLQEFVTSYPAAERALRARFAIAEALFQSGNYAKADPYYQIIVDKRDPVYLLDALLRLGEISYNAGNIDAARKYWETLRKKAPKESILIPEAMYGLALCDLHEGDFLATTKDLDRLTKAFPGYWYLPKIREARSIVLLHQKEHREAAELLEGVTTPAAAFYRGLIFFRQKQYLEAAESFQKLETMAAGQFGEIGAFLKAECFRAADNDSLAADGYDQFVRKFPQSPYRAYALMHEARALLKLGKPADAIKPHQEIKAMQVSKQVQALNMFIGSEISAAMGNYAGAIESIDQVMGLIGKEDTEFYVSLVIAKGYYLLQTGRYAQAENLMRGFVTDMPHHSMAAAGYMLLGNASLQRKDWDTAIASYESAFLKYQYSKLSDVAIAMLLDTYFQAHKYQELVTNSNRIMKVAGTEFASQDFLWKGYSNFLLGEAYYRLKLYPDASRHYEQSMRHPSLAPLATLYLAWSHYHEDKFTEAIRLAQKVLQEAQSTEEQKASAQFLIAGCYFNRKDYDSAVDTFRNFRRRFPNDALVPESLFQEGWAHRQAGYLGDALDAWKKLVAHYPKTVLAEEAEMAVGKLYFQGRQYKQAETAFAKLMALWPKTPAAIEAHWMFAQCFFNDKQDDAAARVYESFLARYPDDPRAKDAEKQLMQVRFRRASDRNDPKLLATFVQQYPKSDLAPDAQYQLAQIIFEEKDYPRAMSAYRKLVLDYPGASQSPMALLTIAHIQERLGHKAEALKEFESVLYLFPTSPVAIDAAMRLGALYFHDEKFDEASKSFRFVQEREAPQGVKNSAIYNLAVSYKKGRYFDQALLTFSQFIEAYPNDPKKRDALLEIASIYRIMDQPEKAVSTYQDILKKGQLSSVTKMEIYNQMGDIYQKMDNQPKAIEAYSHLIPLSPLNQDARLLGLAQLAALYEAHNAWADALKVYAHISRSSGRRGWVQAAVKRMKEIRVYLHSQRASENSVAKDE